MALSEVVKCREKGCGRTFKNRQAELTHYHRVHSGRIAVPNERPKTKTPAGESQERPKRKYAKKANFAITVNFCPQCGCSLQAVAMGIALAGKQE